MMQVGYKGLELDGSISLDLCYPQSIEIIKTRAIPLGIKLVFGNSHLINFFQRLKVSSNALTSADLTKLPSSSVSPASGRPGLPTA